ncbi:MAG: SpoIIE family protein phosphatase [Spirochaetales bacterium]|nr:SpoIIE family protein phosphatase [Spirochaetales bacterium]
MGIPVKLDDLELFFNTIPFGILLFNDEQRVIFANERIHEITGISIESVFNTHFFELLITDEKYLRVANVKVRSAYENDFDDLEIKITKKNSEAVIIHCAASSLDLEEKKHVILAVEDITQRKAFEKVMESSFDNFIQTTIDLDNALKKIKEQRTTLEEYKKHIERELSIARGVQQSLIPLECPKSDTLDIEAATITSSELGGDFYDFYPVEGSRLGIFIADVSGHGVASSLVSSMVKAYMADITDRVDEPKDVLASLNKKVTEAIAGTDFFLTASYMTIDLNSLDTVFANAGHLYTLYFQKKTGTIAHCGEKTKGTVIGSFREVEFTEEQRVLAAGDMLLFFTDGIVEARNAANEFYGSERLELFVKEHENLAPKKFVDKLFSDVKKFAGERAKSDDQTCICVKVKQPVKTRDEKLKIDDAYRNGRKYIRLKQFRSALREYERVLAIEPLAVGAHSAIGQILSICGNYSEAEKHLKKAIEIDPNYHQGYYYVGIVLYNQKKFDEAKKYWLMLRENTGSYKNIDDYIAKVDHSIKLE